jgi:hypothetical protein
VGGHVHDWNWLLGRAGQLASAESIGRLLHLLASGVVLGAWVWLARAAFIVAETQPEIAPRRRPFRRPV